MGPIFADGGEIGSENKRRLSRRRGIAVGVSLLFHVLFALLVFGTLQGAPVAGAEGDGGEGGEAGAINVSLVGPGGSASAAADPSKAALAAMFDRVRAEQSSLPAYDAKPNSRSDVEALFEAIDAARAASGASPGEVKEPSKGGQGAAKGATKSSSADASANGGGVPNHGTVASAGDLWGQIKPCWLAAPGASAVPVTLRFTLNDQGRIAKPPIILRPSGASLDRERLVSETRALAALAGCVPYHSKMPWDTKHEFEVSIGPGR